MAIKSSGRIMLSDITTELGIPLKGFTITSPAARALAGKPTGRIMLSDFYGKSNISSYAITANATDVNLFTLAGSPTKAGKYQFDVANGLVIGQVSGPAAIDFGQFPAGSTVVLNNAGFLYGKGGQPSAGNRNGGDAIKANYPGVEMIINNTGSILPGGGAGGEGGTGGTGGAGGAGTYKNWNPEQYTGATNTAWMIYGNSGTPQGGEYYDTQLWWNGEMVYYLLDSPQFPTATEVLGSDGAWYARRTLRYSDSTLIDGGSGGTDYDYRYAVSRGYTNVATTGGAGGLGGAGGTAGRGQGYNQSRILGAAGSSGGAGAAGGTNAGTGGTGGTGGKGGDGGTYGQAGQSGIAGGTGLTGAAGNVSAGVAGSAGIAGVAGGAAGRAVLKGTANVTLNNNSGTVAGAVA